MEDQKPRILFIVKQRFIEDSSGYSQTISSGLVNSATFVVDMLNANGVEAKIVQVVDNNCIDREVTLYKPTHVAVEALWVIPEKFEILTKLHPNVKWIIRVHSESPFLANEGQAYDWLFQYANLYENVYVSANSTRMQSELEHLLDVNVPYLPNYYPVDMNNTKVYTGTNGEVNVGCFGAIRPLKNHLIQAIGAIKFADSIGAKLKFHVNSNRFEDKGEPVLKNLRALFNNNENHELVEVGWMNHEDFVKVCASMDIGMQISFTETYNIVSADLVNLNVPMVVSDEVPWASKLYKVSCVDADAIASKLEFAYAMRKIGLQKLNKRGLAKNSDASIKTWLNYFKG